jgi:DNA-binding NarL/FixJ family response regulator
VLRLSPLMSQVLSVPARSVPVERPRLEVEVRGSGAVGQRIVAALQADEISVRDSAGRADPVRIVAADLARPMAVGQLRRLLGADRVARIVVVSPECSPMAARRAIRAGADSVVLEPQLETTLAPAVRAVAVGLSALPAPLRGAAERPALSHREREVLRLAIAGHTNGEIAAGLFLAQSTVKSHLSSAYRKLGACGRKEATSLILDPDAGLLEVVFGTEANGQRRNSERAPGYDPLCGGRSLNGAVKSS